MKNQKYRNNQVFRKTMSEWVENSFRTFSKQPTAYEADRFVAENLLFATVRASSRKLPGLNQYDSTFKRFNLVYNALLKTLDNNYHRKPHRQPRTFAFFDQEGTKVGTPIRGNSVTPHVHALILLNPITASDFWHLGLDRFVMFLETRRFSGVTDIDIQRFDDKKGSVGSLVDYASKAYHRNFGRQPDLCADLLKIYPDI